MRAQFRHTALIAGIIFLLLVSGSLVSSRSANNTGSGQTDMILTANNQSKTHATAYALDVQLHEHAALATPTLQAQLLNEPSATAQITAMDNNSRAIANSVEQLYPGTHDQFLQLWRSHIDDYKHYLTAAHDGSQTSKEQAKQDLAQFVSSVTTLLTKANSHIDKAGLNQELTVHTSQTLAIIDALVANDYGSAYTLSGKAYNHMTMVTEAMVPSYKP